MPVNPIHRNQAHLAVSNLTNACNAATAQLTTTIDFPTPDNIVSAIAALRSLETAVIDAAVFTMIVSGEASSV